MHQNKAVLLFDFLATDQAAQVLSVLRGEPPSAPSLGATHRAAPQNPRGRVQWVQALSGQDIIGIARLELAPPAFCYLAELVIAAPFRRSGVGSWFMHSIEQHCISLTIPRLLLQPDPDAVGFYRALKFVREPQFSGFLIKYLYPIPQPLHASAPRRPSACVAFSPAPQLLVTKTP